jgi:antitoxin component YwqK of YwqJK toxin-antitoxin module
MRSILLVYFLLAISNHAFSQDPPIKIYEGKEYYLLPDTFDVGKAMFPFVNPPGYFSQFNLQDGDWIKMTAYRGYENYPSLTGNIVSSNPEGTWTTYSINWDDTTSVISSTRIFRNGVLDGAYKYYFNDGSLQAEYMMKNDKYHGKMIHYTGSGHVTARGAYEFGMHVGEWQYFDNSGTLFKVESYVETIPEEMADVYLSPALFKETFFKNDRMIDELVLKPGADGSWKQYHEGIIQLEKVYDNGLLVYVKEFYPNGIVKAEGPCMGEFPPRPQKRSYDPNERKDDYIRTGTWIYRDESGNVMEEAE